MDDRNKVSDEFFLMGEAAFVENHDPAIVLVCNSLDKLKPKSAQSVSVSDNHFFDVSRHDSVQ